MSEAIKDVYSFLIPIQGNSLLLPNSTVAEIVPFMNVTLFDGIEKSEDWKLGTVAWRNLNIPVISLERLQGKQDLGEIRRSRIAIVYTLNGNQEIPYVALLVQGIPRLIPVDAENSHMTNDSPKFEGIKAEVTVDGKVALVPDIDAMETLLTDN